MLGSRVRKAGCESNLVEEEIFVRSEKLVDPELLEILRQMPSLETSAATLVSMREAMLGWKLTAPDAPEVRSKELFIDVTDGQQVRVIVYHPANKTPTGALLWIHGGGMVMGAPEMNDAPNRHIAQQAGCIVVAVAYRLAPEASYPAALEDCYAALRWMHTEADALGIPRERIAVAGESGGGALSAGLCLLARDRGEIPLSAQFLMFPMLDDRTGTSTEITPMPFSGEFVWDRSSNSFCWNAVLGERPLAADIPAYASPGRVEVLAGLPHTFISVGDVDLFIGEDLRFAQRLIRDGVSTEMHVYAGAAHGFTAWGAQTEIARRCQREFWGRLSVTSVRIVAEV